MATLQERYDAQCLLLERALRAGSHGDKRAEWDLDRMAKERDRLARELAAEQPEQRSTRTLLTMEEE